MGAYSAFIFPPDIAFSPPRLCSSFSLSVTLCVSPSRSLPLFFFALPLSLRLSRFPLFPSSASERVLAVRTRSRSTRGWISAAYFSQLNGQHDIRADGISLSRCTAAPAFLSIYGPAEDDDGGRGGAEERESPSSGSYPDSSVPHAFVENNRSARILKRAVALISVAPLLSHPRRLFPSISRPSVHLSVRTVVRAIFFPAAESLRDRLRAFRPTFQLVPRYCYRCWFNVHVYYVPSSTSSSSCYRDVPARRTFIPLLYSESRLRGDRAPGADGSAGLNGARGLCVCK